MTTYKATERQTLLEIAQEYERKGYQVTVEPELHALPEFLSDYRPDLIARSANESVVVEVKSYASLVSSNGLLSQLAQAVQEKPGWRIELMVVNPKRSGQIGSSPKSAVLDRLADASQLQSEGYFRAALLATLSALEAALLLASDSSSVGRMKQSALISANLLSQQGLLASKEYVVVTQALNLKPSLAHTPAGETSDSSIVDNLLPIISALVERTNISHEPTILAAA